MYCKSCGSNISDDRGGICPQCSVSLTVHVDSPHTVMASHYPTGTILADRYRIVRLLGQGGMGSVYQAEDLTLKTPVALKFVTASFKQNQEYLEFLINEARIARSVTHPNVCRIHDVAMVNEQYFLSMEYIEGEDLESLLRRIGRLPKDKALDLGMEICQGLAAAHEHGILHRDLKPGNLMIDFRGHARVMDFGLAALGSKPDAQKQTIGTPMYMAPEQRQGQISKQSDIYSLGLVLYELMTGRKAYHDLAEEDGTIDFSRIPAEVANELDPAAERIIRKCLDRDPISRPSSAHTVAAMLSQLRAPAWRPAAGAAVPHRDNWVLEKKLGQGGFGETWLAAHSKTHDLRVFKFCSDLARLRAFQREITLFRFLREELGSREDIARILDWRLENPPYFIELEYTAGGNLLQWIESHGGIEQIPIDQRLEIVAQTAVALSAAHSVGLLHKDIKPANLLVNSTADGQPRIRLCDFGVGALTDRERLQIAGITAAGITDADNVDPSSYAGTRLYMAPEILEGKLATTGADIYALGVLLFQAVVGDFSRALAPGWEREIQDEILLEDIASAIDRNAERRCSALQMADKLRTLPQRRALRETDLEARMHAEMTSENLKRSRKRRKWATAALGFLLLLMIAIWIFFDHAEATAREALIAQAMS